jgi:hypothetical protein
MSKEQVEQYLEKMVMQVLEAKPDYLGPVQLTLTVTQQEADSVMAFLSLIREASQKKWDERRKAGEQR